MGLENRIKRWYRLFYNFKRSQRKIEQLEKNVINILNSRFEKLGSDKHSSGYYYGASLTALSKLGIQNGYSLICCDSEGVNAFFIRNNIISNQELKFKCLEPK